MPCGGPKKSHRTSSIVQIIFSFWPFEISEGIRRNQKLIIGLDSFSNQSWSGNLFLIAPFPDLCLLVPFYIFGSVWILPVFVSTALLKVSKLQYFILPNLKGH